MMGVVITIENEMITIMSVYVSRYFCSTVKKDLSMINGV